jgi:hypothetical protein
MLDYQVVGLPLHVLLVHAVVVGVPFLAAVLVVLAAWPGARRVLWLPTLAGGLLLLGLTFLTIEAGKWLEARVPPTPLIQEHTAQGEDIVPWMFGLVAVAAVVSALAIVEQRQRRDRTAPEVAAARGFVQTVSRPSPARTVVVVLLVIAALGVGAGATWTIIRIGEAGSRAVWEGSFSDEPLER